MSEPIKYRQRTQWTEADQDLNGFLARAGMGRGQHPVANPVTLREVQLARDGEDAPRDGFQRAREQEHDPHRLILQNCGYCFV